jgi:hypothetical protein
MNNCIGVSNHKCFLLFLFYVTITSVHFIILVAIQRISCTSGDAFCGYDSGQFPGRLGIYLLAGACTFGLFCIVMLVMEIYSIDDDMLYSTISKRLHVRLGCKSKSRVERHLSVICGTNGFEWTWLLPIPLQRNRHEERIIYGIDAGGDRDGSEA